MSVRCALILFVIVVVDVAQAGGTGTCVLSDPAVSGCDMATVIPGTPGQHVLLVDASNAIGLRSTSCGPDAENMAWFEVTPDVSGPITLSTCHPSTTYDTLIEVFSGGDNNCDFMTAIACDDDTADPLCDNGCAFQSARVTFNATAGARYRIMVGAASTNPQCLRCMGLTVTIGQPCGDPPWNIGPCDAARDLSGAPGTHEAQIDVADAVVLPNEPLPNASCTDADVLGHTVWFHVVPDQESVLTFNTCHANTSYDTVVQIFTGGLCTQGGLSSLVACSDDGGDASCVNQCSPWHIGSRVTFDGHAGQDYWIQVGSYNDNAGGCTDMCLDATLDVVDCTLINPPVAHLSDPKELPAGCACEPVQVVGSAFVTNGGFSAYTLEFRSSGSEIWSQIAAGTSEVVGGVLGTWDTSALSQGYYVLRLTTSTVCGERAVATRMVFLDKAFDTVAVRYPPVTTPNNETPIVARTVCFEGSVFESWCWHPQSTNAHFKAEYRPAGGGAFTPMDPSHPTYTSTVVNDPIAQWDTVGLGLPDGSYELRLTAENDCGKTKTVTRDVVVDNTPPTAMITSPQPCVYVADVVTVKGTVIDAHLDFWVLEYTGGPVSGWTPITASQSNNVVNGVLGLWDTSQLPPCAYTLRLRAYDRAVLGCGSGVRQWAEYTTSINVGFCGDFDADDDSDVDLIDFGAFESAFTGPHP